MSDHLHTDVDNLEHPACPLSEQPIPLDRTLFEYPIGEPSRLRIILIGPAADVDQEILNLYHCGYAIDGWSPPQRVPNSTDVITVYTKRTYRVTGWQGGGDR